MLKPHGRIPTAMTGLPMMIINWFNKSADLGHLLFDEKAYQTSPSMQRRATTQKHVKLPRHCSFMSLDHYLSISQHMIASGRAL
jgi:hypothetical protein